jgi:hypothetical protein
MPTNKKKKIPDLVVYNEEKGYYARELTYGSNAGAPAINIEDVQGWKQNQANKANKQFKKKYDELKEEFKKLVDEVNWNDLVYSAGYTFKPILGTIYHLYMRKDETMFLSLIDPNTWNQDYIGSFELDSTEKWIKVEFFVK